ncbi:4Fe-4S binding protein [Natranaerofaba carboxydovora]|uniref:4Fe-4S binding protein n=1 Tax=Natranaerofaba carboxydovora TaxID=2742683 RepID=UPI001F147FAD|nr:4Fe-4S binding protein [Natranaerofaba carboxydovora]UMZ74238.1 4Fe-4S binding domain protein [Natranaerofaba carboxydovora]
MAYEYHTPRPKLIYDKEKCGNAYHCLKCVETSNRVGCLCIAWMNTETPERGKPQKYEDIDWKIVTGFMTNCWGCNKCVEACPNDALRLEMPESREPAARVQRSDIIFCYTLKDGTKITTRGKESES